MTHPVMRVENLSKAYRIGRKQELPDTLFSAATSWLRAPVRNLRNLTRLNTFSIDGDDDEDIIWALNDVSFEVSQGEVLGIVGRNGAGKSTLLKILSRITEPTSGEAVIRGRVSSLLEVGTGFHPELSGRENVYLNGTILGMKKREIDRKFDEIVDFSGVEKFLDTPIKRYSSGMKVRLAFSVAAYLEPEILIIDEVLAVGDGEFQKKCIGKMHDVAGQGRTVLFVSHNMPAILDLCSRAIRISNGRIVANDTTRRVILEYENELLAAGSTHNNGLECVAQLRESEDFCVAGICVNGHKSVDGQSYLSTFPLQVEIRCKTRVSVKDLLFGFGVLNQSGDVCIWERLTGNAIAGEHTTGAIQLTVNVPPLPLKSGIYSINFMARPLRSLDKVCDVKQCAHFSIETPPSLGSSNGLLAPQLSWSFQSSLLQNP